MFKHWRKLLFKLHLTNSYPIMMQGVSGHTFQANMIRTDGKSYDIRPDIARANKNIRVDSDGIVRPIDPSKPAQFNVYTPGGSTDRYGKPEAIDD